MPELRTLYRPVGVREMVRILEADARQFPPRRPEQPIFYPVLNRPYAEQIASRWNTTSPISGYAGFVTEFQIDADYVARFEEQVVGAAMHRELWVPSEELPEFNRHIAGRIAMVSAHYGPDYTGPIPDQSGLKGRTAAEQILTLHGMVEDSGADFTHEVRHQPVAVQLNFAYWVRHDFTAQGLSDADKATVLRAILDVWQAAFPAIHLVGGDELLAHGRE